jgi:hypothetical protein
LPQCKIKMAADELPREFLILRSGLLAASRRLAASEIGASWFEKRGVAALLTMMI